MLSRLHFKRRFLVLLEAAQSSEMNAGIRNLLNQRCFIVCFSFGDCVGHYEIDELLDFSVEDVVAESVGH